MKIFLPLILGISILSCGSKSKDIQIREMVANGATILDVRTPQEFSQGKIDGAINIPISDLDGRMDDFDDKKGVLVYCAAGVRAAQAKRKLNKYGIPNVVNGINISRIQKALEGK